MFKTVSAPPLVKVVMPVTRVEFCAFVRLSSIKVVPASDNLLLTVTVPMVLFVPGEKSELVFTITAPAMVPTPVNLPPPIVTVVLPSAPSTSRVPLLTVVLPV